MNSSVDMVFSMIEIKLMDLKGPKYHNHGDYRTVRLIALDVVNVASL